MRAFCDFFSRTVLTTITLVLSVQFAVAKQDVSGIVRQSAEANKRDWAAAPDFDYSERDRTKGGDKTYAVPMIEGTPYERMIAINGHALNAARRQDE